MSGGGGSVLYVLKQIYRMSKAGQKSAQEPWELTQILVLFFLSQGSSLSSDKADFYVPYRGSSSTSSTLMRQAEQWDISTEVLNTTLKAF